MLTRVDTFSIILVIDRSRAPGSLQPLGSFLFTGVVVKELTSPTSLRHWICQKHSHYGVEHKQSSHLEEAIMSKMEFIHLLRR